MNITENPSCYIVHLEPYGYLLMSFGAGIGYFFIGSIFSALCCKFQREALNNEASEIILANAI
jgi:hypothetical protein